MKKLLSIFFFCCFFVLLFFFLLRGLETEMFRFLESRESFGLYSLFSFLVLSSDILMPVPSSLVMILNGKILGFFSGTLLSTAAGMFSSAAGFYFGRKSDSFLNRFFSKKQQDYSNRLFLRYGRSAIVFSKALPVVSESIAFLSGTTGISFGRFLWLSFFGHLGISMIYAYVGNYAASIDSNWISASVIFLVLLIFWLMSKFLQPERKSS